MQWRYTFTIGNIVRVERATPPAGSQPAVSH
jgi:hypothetical protein